MYPATKIHEGLEADERLRQLGIDGDVLREAQKSGLTARYSCSDSAPRTGPGLMHWLVEVETLREGFRLAGWTRADDGNFPRAVSPDTTVAIAVVGGDSATGRTGPNDSPTCARRRGKATRRAVKRNIAQLELFPSAIPTPLRPDQPMTWFFLSFLDESAGEVRMELSCAIEEDDGFISGWADRIILPPISLDTVDPSRRRADDDEGEGEQITVDVRRR